MDKQMLLEAVSRLLENSHATGSSVAYDQAVNQYNYLLQSAKDLYPERSDIQGLRRYRRTYNVPVNAFEDAGARLQTALAFDSVAALEPLFSELRLPPAKSIVFETTSAVYTVDRVVGEGGAGRVYKVNDANNVVFAIKLLDPTRGTEERVKRFKNEFHFGQRNKHANIVTLIEDGLLKVGERSLPFYVMPFYEDSLRSLMSEPIAPTKALGHFTQLLNGVEAAHAKGVVHRDLKPENILYDRSRDMLLIADFGIARFQEEELFTAVETGHNAKLANFQYAAPEQRDRQATVDQRADIFALGLILNEMFTGQVPHGTHYKTVESVAPELKYLDEVVAVMLHRSPDKRPQSVAEIRELFESSRSNQTERAPTEEELLQFMGSDTRQIYEMAEMSARARQQLREGVVKEWKAAQKREKRKT